MIASTENTSPDTSPKPATAKPVAFLGGEAAGFRLRHVPADDRDDAAKAAARSAQDTADKTDHGEGIGLAGRYVHGCPLQGVTLRLIDTYR